MPIEITRRTLRDCVEPVGSALLRGFLGTLLTAGVAACAPSSPGPGAASPPRQATRRDPPAPTPAEATPSATRDTTPASTPSPPTRTGDDLREEREPSVTAALAAPLSVSSDAPTAPPSARPGTRPDGTPPAVPFPAGTPDAATRLVATYFEALARHRDADAALAWRDDAQAAAFLRRYIGLGRPRVILDAPGPIEGAAGSLYVTVPVRFAATPAPGHSRDRHGEVVLRRVNDVPGSTAAQRRWRIERIDIAMTPK